MFFKMESEIVSTFVFFLFLLLHFDGVYSSYRSLGCEYKSERYDTGSNIPLWAEESGSLHINNTADWKRFLVDLTDIYNNKLKPRERYNNVMDYNSLFDEFEDQESSNDNFRKFYRSYSPKLTFRSNEFRKTINIMRAIVVKLIETFDEELIYKSVYLGAGLMSPPEDLLNYIKSQKPGEDPIVNYYLYVPGVIRFTLGDAKRPGYILIGENGPIVVMEDEKEPHSGFNQYDDLNLDFKIWDSNKDYIVSQRKDKKNQRIIDFMVFVSRPYCSVAETSFKYSLLSPIKALIEKGVNESYHGFYVDLDFLNLEKPVLTLLKKNGEKKNIKLFTYHVDKENNLESEQNESETDTEADKQNHEEDQIKLKETIELINKYKSLLPKFDAENEKFIQDVNDELYSEDVILEMLDDEHILPGDREKARETSSIFLHLLISDLGQAFYSDKINTGIAEVSKHELSLVREDLKIDSVGKHFDHFQMTVSRKLKYLLPVERNKFSLREPHIVCVNCRIS